MANDFFWDLYHEISGLEPIDKEMALRYWKHLNGDERMMAVASISVYLDSNPRSRWRTAVAMSLSLHDGPVRHTPKTSICRLSGAVP